MLISFSFFIQITKWQHISSKTNECIYVICNLNNLTDNKASLYLENMAAQNLTLSIRQHIKFFLMKHHVLDWVRGNKTNNRQHLLYDTGKAADKLFAYILNDSFAYRHIWKNGGATIEDRTAGE
jgi:hypothetical protein